MDKQELVKEFEKQAKKEYDDLVNVMLYRNCNNKAYTVSKLIVEKRDIYGKSESIEIVASEETYNEVINHVPPSGDSVRDEVTATPHSQQNPTKQSSSEVVTPEPQPKINLDTVSIVTPPQDNDTNTLKDDSDKTGNNLASTSPPEVKSTDITKLKNNRNKESLMDKIKKTISKGDANAKK